MMPLKVSDGIGAWIDDFQKSDAPQFKGHSKEKRRDQAVAAYLSAKRGKQNESVHEDVKYPHKMYDPKTGKEVMAKTPDDHNKYNKMGYVHEKPKMNEGMATGNESGMMFRVKVEGLPDMIMVGRSPSDIKQQLRKIVKQPSMIDSVDRIPKSQVRKMYRDLAGGKDIDENYLHDYGSPESVKMMKKMTPGENSLDKAMKIRKKKKDKC